MSNRELLEEDSFNTNSKQYTKSTEEVTNADLLSLLKTYRNDKLSGIENNLNDTAVNLAIKVKKAEPSFRFKGNQVQIELNAEISGNINVVLSELGKECTKSCKVIGGFVCRSQEEEQVNTNRRQVRMKLDNR